jgi:hypothetical protein
MMEGQFHVPGRGLSPGTAVFEKTGESALARIEVDGRHSKPGFKKRDRDMDRQGRFAGAAFFIADNDDMRRAQVWRLEKRGLGLRCHEFGLALIIPDLVPERWTHLSGSWPMTFGPLSNFRHRFEKAKI